MRTRFGPRENANATVLEGLFEGHGTSGRLINLSIEGFCMRLEKALSIQENRRLAIHPDLFRASQELMVVRLLDLPHAPRVECSGRVTHIEDGPEGVTMGVHLEGVGTLESQILTRVLSARIPTFTRGFPQKRRRSELDLETTSVPTLAQETGEALVPESLDLLPDGPEVEEPHGGPSDRVLRLKKRGRRILLVQIDDLDRAILAGTLLVDGFSQVKEARSFSESLQCVREGPLDLILLEHPLGAVSAPQFLERLRKLGHCEEVPVILLTDQEDVRTTLMAKMQHIAHLQPRPVDYDGSFREVLYRELKLF
jgi:CheY-like chemotaxis protein